MTTMNPDDIDLVMTSAACPEQYDAIHAGHTVGYLRLRHGRFTVRCPDPAGLLVYESLTYGDGSFDERESDYHLGKAREAIAAHYPLAVHASTTEAKDWESDSGNATTVPFSDSFNREVGQLGSAWREPTGPPTFMPLDLERSSWSIALRDTIKDDGAMLHMVGRMNTSDGVALRIEDQFGTTIRWDTRCTACDARVEEGHYYWATHGPKMSGTIRHQNCNDPTQRGSQP